MKTQLSRTLVIITLYLVLADVRYGFCVEQDHLCVACDPLSHLCIECAGGYLGNDRKCQRASGLIDFCFSYQTEGICRVCQYGYYLTDTGVCLEIEEKNCMVWDSDTKTCTVCRNNKLPNMEGKCDNKNDCEIANCKYCVARGETPNCVECNKGYSMVFLNSVASCIQETPSVSNCTTLYSHDNLKCFICDAPYYNMNGSCFLSKAYSIDKGVSIQKIFAGLLGAMSLMLFV